MSQEFYNISYKRHCNHHQNTFDINKLNAWKRKDTTDYWIHERMFSNLDPIIESDLNSKWLTVGDGRYGCDANYIFSKGINNVLATNISDTYLKIALKDGYIKQYKIENAEALSFENNSFDYVLCKEAYHHFPRPMIALYEMLRVAKKSVILIEPQDYNILTPYRFNLLALIKWSYIVIKNCIKTINGKKSEYNFGRYEKVGNYVYTISEREIEKVALGLNYKMVSFKGMDHSYIKGIEYETKSDDAPLYKQIQSNIKRKKKLSQIGLRNYSLLVAIIHKTLPDEATLIKLQKNGFINHKLSQNPYC